MTVFAWTEGGRITVQARADGPDGTVGDLQRDVAPGGEFWGIPYAWLADHLGTFVVEEAWAALGITLDANNRLKVPAAVQAQITTGKAR